MGHTIRTSTSTINWMSDTYRKEEDQTYLIKVRDFGDIDEIDHCVILDFLSNGVQSLVHCHALTVPVMSEPNNDHTILLGFDSFVDMPARGEMREEIGHGGSGKPWRLYFVTTPNIMLQVISREMPIRIAQFSPRGAKASVETLM